MRGWIMRERKQHYGAERMRPIHEQQSRIINFFQEQRSSPQKKVPLKKVSLKKFCPQKVPLEHAQNDRGWVQIVG